MICKLGGEPWSVKIPLPDTMVIGYDTYHDTVSKGRSVGAMVASLNKTMTKYISIANIHTNPDQELHDNLCPAIITALRKYQEVNGRLPERIIVYRCVQSPCLSSYLNLPFRDGVGDGQIPQVQDLEVKAIQDTLIKVGMSEKDMKFTFIVVNKRINTKIIKKDGSNLSNPPSGTIVDDVVTLPERFDFFLVSQSVTQGTVNPTNYNVLLVRSRLSYIYLDFVLFWGTLIFIHESFPPGPQWAGSGEAAETDVQAVPPLLQLARHSACARPLPVRPQGEAHTGTPDTSHITHITHLLLQLAFLVGETLHNCPKGYLLDTLFYL